MTDALVVRGLTISSAQGLLVHEVSLAVARGRNLTILGETGSGKSLLAQAIMGTLPAGLTARGEITIDGTTTDAAAHTRRHHWGRTLAILPQEPWRALDPTMRAIGQVAEGYRETSPPEARARAQAAMRALGLAAADRLFPFMLSGGMAQRVALAGATAGGASIVIVDEPTKGLDAAVRDDAMALLKSVLTGGRSLLTITHDIHVARSLGGQVAVLLDGIVVEQGEAETVLHTPRHEYTKRLLAAEPSAWPTRVVSPRGEPVLTARGLSKRYGSRTLFENLDVEIRAGQRMSIVGPSGSGKTTLGDILVGVTRADTGTIERGHGLPALRFQKLYQDPPAAFAPRITLRRAIEDLRVRHHLDKREVEALMSRLRLQTHLLDRRPDQVSGGELQRFALLRVLLLSPAVIFADEPTSRLDPITQQETIDVLVQHAAERGCALLLVTHDAQIGANVAGDAVVPIGHRTSTVTR